MDVVRVCKICKVQEIPFDSDYDMCPECIRKQRKKYTVRAFIFGVLIAVFGLLILSPVDLLSFSPIDDLIMIVPLLLSIGGEIYTAVMKERFSDPSKAYDFEG